MQRRTYRGPITARGLADALVNRFNTGHLLTQSAGDDDHMIIQIIAREREWSGQTHAALTIAIVQYENAVEVSIGEQQWLGPAADLLRAGLLGWFRPLSLLGEVANMADDIKTLSLPSEVWEAVEHYVESVGARLGLEEDDRMVACPFCGVGNPVGVGKCSACGGSLAKVQPQACPKCGALSPHTAYFCARCGTQLRSSVP